MTAILELRRRGPAGIFAVPYRRGRRLGALRLPDGAIVEAPDHDQRHEAPDRPAGCLGLGRGGGPATVHDANLGLVVAYLPLEGLFLLANGDVAAVYGAEAIPLDGPVHT